MSSDKFSNTKYDELFEDHEKKAKRILKKNISKNINTLNRYCFDILTSHNNFVEYVGKFYKNFNSDSRETVNTHLRNLSEKTEKCCNRLNEEENFNEQINFSDNLLKTIEINITYDSEIESTGTASTDSELEENGLEPHEQSNLTLVDSLNESADSDSDLNDQNKSKTQHNHQPSEQQKIKMTHKENREFLSFLDRTINKSYSGDPLTLKSFINKINLAKMSTEDGQAELLKAFVVSRLEGKALECVDTSKNLDTIMATLQSCIKPDSSKVVEGKILSLRFNKSNSSEFSKQAEELAEALQRSLVIEGYSLEKAKELTVERTVEMCRQNARNESVKTVLAAKDFKDPKEVVAKLIVQESSVDREKQILFFNKNGQNRQNKPFFKRYNNNHSNNNHNGNNFKNNWNKGGNSSRGRFQRGRGRFGGNRGNHNRQYNVRMAENCDAPSVSRREQEQAPNEPAFTLVGVNRN